MNLAEKYIKDVLSGKELVGKYTRLAVERHKKDLKRKSIFFDKEAGELALTICKLLKHTKGEAAKGYFRLKPYQAFILYSIFGWKRKNGTRRFRKAYYEVARKGVKTELQSVIEIIMFLFDGEEGAQCFNVATKVKQAKIAYETTKIMLKKLALESDAIHEKVGFRQSAIHDFSTNSYITVLGRDSDTDDGFDPSYGGVDEYHAHKSSAVLEIIETGMGARSQPLIFITTTAGFNIFGPCYHLRKVTMQILEGVKKDDSYFGIIYHMDEGDDWKDKTKWKKANPNIGNTPNWDYMNDMFQKALNEGTSKEIQFKTKNLNIWTTSSETWIQDETWMDCLEKYDEKDLHGERCIVGIDLASTKDCNAIALLFPDKMCFLEYYLTPKDTAIERSKNDRVDYLQWADDGFMILTPGNSRDDESIKNLLFEINSKFKIISISYDPWKAQNLIHLLNDIDVDTVEVKMDIKSLAPPTDQLEIWVNKKQIKHNGHPISRWMFSNTEIVRDENENIKPSRKKSREKIDGVIAMVICINEYMNTLMNPKEESALTSGELLDYINES